MLLLPSSRWSGFNLGLADLRVSGWPGLAEAFRKVVGRHLCCVKELAQFKVLPAFAHRRRHPESSWAHTWSWILLSPTRVGGRETVENSSWKFAVEEDKATPTSISSAGLLVEDRFRSPWIVVEELIFTRRDDRDTVGPVESGANGPWPCFWKLFGSPKAVLGCHAGSAGLSTVADLEGAS